MRTTDREHYIQAVKNDVSDGDEMLVFLNDDCCVFVCVDTCIFKQEYLKWLLIRKSCQIL